MMDWESRLIGLYLLICNEHDTYLADFSQRMSNNQQEPEFTDAEAMTVQIFGLMQGHRTASAIHRYTLDHLHGLFPNLPSYTNFTKRLNRLADCFVVLAERLLEPVRADIRSHTSTHIMLVDSLPIMLAQAPRSASAAVAPELASKGYCSSKSTYYYGLKLHVVAGKQDRTMPRPYALGLGPAAEHDLEGLDRLVGLLPEGDLYGDRAYRSEPARRALAENHGIWLLTPIKKKPKGPDLDYLQKVYNTSISRTRQSIEVFFNWLIERFDIQRASKIRSAAGVVRHVFARVAAAAFLMFYP